MARPRTKNKGLPHHIYRARGKYQLRYPDGHTKLFPTLQAAVIEWAAWWGGEGNSLSSVMDSYISSELPKKAERTQQYYLAALTNRLRPVFGHMQPRQIKPAHLYQYLDTQPKVQGNRDMAVMSVVLGHAIRKGLLDRNPCREVKRNPEKPRERLPARAELRAAVKLASPKLALVMRWLAKTGMRESDMLALTDEAITEAGLLWRQGKTGKWVLMEWDDDLRALAPQIIALEWTMSGLQSAKQRFNRVWTGEPFTLHDLRAYRGSEADDWRALGHTNREVYERVYNRKAVVVSPGAGI